MGLAEGAGEKDEGAASEDVEPQPVFFRSLVMVAVGIAMLKFGADLVVDNATAIASAMGISERIIGITVGSNISNLLLVMGGPALFASIPYDTAYNVDLALLAIFSLVLVGFAFIGRRHEMSRANGVVFVVLYAAYLATSVLR